AADEPDLARVRPLQWREARRRERAWMTTWAGPRRDEARRFGRQRRARRIRLEEQHLGALTRKGDARPARRIAAADGDRPCFHAVARVFDAPVVGMHATHAVAGLHEQRAVGVERQRTPARQSALRTWRNLDGALRRGALRPHGAQIFLEG